MVQSSRRKSPVPRLLACLLPGFLMMTFASGEAAPVTVPAVPLAREAALLPVATTISAITGNPLLRSTNGAEFELLSFASPAAPALPGGVHRFLVEGGLHGNEEQTSQFVLWLAERYGRGESPLSELARHHKIAIDFLPRANPDGDVQRNRYNSRGVNLNRNFAVLWGMSRENPGNTSFSEPETRAIRGLFARRHYTAAVDVHGYINWVVAPSDPDSLAARGLTATAFQRQAYRQWRETLLAAMPHLSQGYELKTGALLGDGGAFEDWAFWNQGTFAFCLEMETFQRFVPLHAAALAAEAAATPAASSIDLFKRYEMFIVTTFARALELRHDAPQPDTTLARAAE